jgi:hypothetical protein
MSASPPVVVPADVPQRDAPPGAVSQLQFQPLFADGHSQDLKGFRLAVPPLDVNGIWAAWIIIHIRRLRGEFIMRASVLLLLCSLAGVLAGGWLTGRVGFGLCVIADSVAVGVYALRRDDGVPAPPLQDLQPNAWAVAGTVHDVLERARVAS